jgi:hypothetical protein
MKYLKPMSLRTEFEFQILNEFVQKIINASAYTIFDGVTIVHVGREVTQVKCHFSTTIQGYKAENISFKNAENFEKRSRKTFLSRIADVKYAIVEIKESTTIRFTSDKYKPR